MYLVTRPSRFLTEIDAELSEQAALESDIDLSWSGIAEFKGPEESSGLD